MWGGALTHTHMYTHACEVCKGTREANNFGCLQQGADHWGRNRRKTVHPGVLQTTCWGRRQWVLSSVKGQHVLSTFSRSLLSVSLTLCVWQHPNWSLPFSWTGVHCFHAWLTMSHCYKSSQFFNSDSEFLLCTRSKEFVNWHCHIHFVLLTVSILPIKKGLL